MYFSFVVWFASAFLDTLLKNIYHEQNILFVSDAYRLEFYGFILWSVCVFQKHSFFSTSCKFFSLLSRMSFAIGVWAIKIFWRKIWRVSLHCFIQIKLEFRRIFCNFFLNWNQPTWKISTETNWPDVYSNEKIYWHQKRWKHSNLDRFQWIFS